MSCFTLSVSDQASWETLNAIGLLDSVHFHDENSETPSVSRECYHSIKRCDEVMSKLEFVYKEVDKMGLKTLGCSDPKEYLIRLNGRLGSSSLPQHTYFDELEGIIEERHKLLVNQVTNYQQVVNNVNTLSEHLHSLRMARKFLPNDFDTKTPPKLPTLSSLPDDKPILVDHGFQVSGIGLKYIAGIVESQNISSLKKLIHRVTRGNAITFTGDIEYELDYLGRPIAPLIDLETGRVLHKSVFLIVYSKTTGSNDVMRFKIFRIIDSMGSARFDIPESPLAFSNMLSELNVSLSQTQDIMERTKMGIADLLQSFVKPKSGSGYSPIEEYKMCILKEKAIYAQMNMMKRKDRMHHGRIWIPKKKVPEFFWALEDLQTMVKPEVKLISSPDSMGLKPPTFFQVNEFTMPFQALVDTYGVPRYKEVNPGLFAIATFPILFGVMFGDVVHGAVLAALFGYSIGWKSQIDRNNGLFKPVLPFRYMMFLMGCCALYFGLLYNDAGGFATDFFGSCYDENKEPVEGCVYPFGMDPVWTESEKNITFMNSLKMKMAVIFGITHMVWGILQKGSNAIYFKSPVDFFFEFLPQLIFFGGLFGYMVLCIFLKWATYWGDGHSAPSIITLFIMIGSAWDQNGSKSFSPLYGDEAGQLEHRIEICLLSNSNWFLNA